MPTSEQNAWIARVLQIDLQAVATPDDIGKFDEAGELAERLADAKVRVQRQVRAGFEDADELSADFERISGLVATLAPTASTELLALEEALYAAESASRAQSIAPEIRVPMALRKLMIEWRAAQSTADADIRALGDAFLSDPEVQADPRFDDDVFDVVKDLPDEIPDFGAKLADAVDAVFTDGGKTKSILAASLGVVAEYQAMISGSILPDLEDLGSELYGREFRISKPLTEALGTIETQLKAMA